MIRCFLSALGLALIAIVATVIWYEGVSLPFVGQVIYGEVAGRLEGYVALSEKVATDAKLAEIKRQAEASKAATEQFRKRVIEAEAAEAVAEADLENRISIYEKRLAEEKRRCEFSADDVDSILQHR